MLVLRTEVHVSETAPEGSAATIEGPVFRRVSAAGTDVVAVAIGDNVRLSDAEAAVGRILARLMSYRLTLELKAGEGPGAKPPEDDLEWSATV